MPFDRMIAPLTGLPRGLKRAAAMVVDGCLAVLTVSIAFYLRLGYWVALSDQGWQAAILSLLAIPIFHLLGIYRTAFRHGASAIVPATIVYGLIFAAIVSAYGIDTVPRTIGFIQPPLFLLAVIVSRAAVQFWLGGGYRRFATTRKGRTRVLIYGAGSAGRQLAHALAESSAIRAMGFIDDDPNLSGSIIGGLKVWRGTDIGEIAAREEVTEVFLAIPSAGRQRRNEILDVLRREGLATRTLPGILDIAHGTVTVTDLRPLEIDDLLGRDAVAPIGDLLERNIRGKCVAVTGAGGSIGGELCRQIIRACPATLLLFDVSEFALYAVHQELLEMQDAERPVALVPLLGSVTDAARLDDIFATWRPHTVYHAAAYKHVPLVEHNVVDGVRNNVLGTWRVATAARRHEAENVVLVSTDKAVRPTNVMGASKRMAEMLLQALAAGGRSDEGKTDGSAATCFSMVRFGNVLGSSGSVVPLFRQQIAMGGPLTVTHPDIIRYFMTIPEAAQLVLQAGAMGQGGEVFVLDMGEPVRIHDLAVRMIELAGLRVRDGDEGDIEIVFSGLRPGEKLYEELLIGDDPAPTRHPRVMMANERCLPPAEMEEALGELTGALERRDVARVRDLLMRVVGDFAPTSPVVDWVATASNAEPRIAGA